MKTYVITVVAEDGSDAAEVLTKTVAPQLAEGYVEGSQRAGDGSSFTFRASEG